jgi:uncharacterized lipoprotein YbaY
VLPKRRAAARQVPVPFELAYDPAKIDPRFRYTVAARILVNGELRWISQESYPVLTQATHPATLKLSLTRAQHRRIPDQSGRCSRWSSMAPQSG